MRTVEHIVIHCSATPDGDGRFGLEQIDQMHRDRGWRKVGYHYVIEVDGGIHVGRMLEEIGAHVAGSNAKSVGVCMIGTSRFTAEQWGSLRELVNELQGRFPGASVWGHRDFSPDRDGDGVIDPWEHFKLCPGFAVDAWRLSGMDPQWNLEHRYSSVMV